MQSHYRRQREGRSRRRLRAGLVVIALAALASMAALLVTGRGMRAGALEEWRRRLEVVAENRRLGLERWLDVGVGDAATIAYFPSVVALARGQDRGGLREHVVSFLRSLALHRGYRAICVRSPDGRDLATVTVSGGPGGCAAAPDRAPTSHLASFTAESGRLVLSFAAPIWPRGDGVGSGIETPLGAVILDEDAERGLAAVLSPQTLALTGTGEAILVQREGDRVAFVSPLRFRAAPPLSLRLRLDDPGLAATQALQGDAAYVEGTDYRGHAVLAALRPIRRAPWAVVVKVDREEALGPVRQRLTLAATADVNPQITAVTGYRPEEVIGQNPRILKSGQHPPDFYRDLWTTILAGREWRGEICNRKKSGELFWESASISGVGEGGAITHFVAVKLDVSERRRLEAEYRQAQKMEAIGRLAGGVAHDFNNVLTIIQGQAELLLMQLGEPDPRRRKLEQIKRAAERAAGLSRQLLAFSRRQALEPRPVDVAALAADMEKMLRRLIGEDITLVVRGEPGTARVLADPGQLEQVLLNLVINARDAMPRGGTLTIETDAVDVAPAEASWRPGLTAGPAVRLRVSDTGSGIPAEIRERIFEPFFTTKGEGKGTGLGLSIVYGVVRQSGGAVWVDSQVGRGATFTVMLPRLDRAGPGAAPPGEAPAAGLGETILLVEDQAEVRAIMAEVLGAAGYRVLEATDGDSALALAATYAGPIHLLVTDVVMPGRNGREVAEALRAQRPDIGVLFVSGYTADVLTAHGLEAGQAALMEKPATPAALRGKVRDLLDARLDRARI